MPADLLCIDSTIMNNLQIRKQTWVVGWIENLQQCSTILAHEEPEDACNQLEDKHWVEGE